jgi:hypothetical protein
MFLFYVAEAALQPNSALQRTIPFLQPVTTAANILRAAE